MNGVARSALFAAWGVTVAVTSARADPNLARGRAYTLRPPPNYPLATDAGDLAQLTDGEYARSVLGRVTGRRLWTSSDAVAWLAREPIVITIDLGAPRAVTGASFHTAAGEAGVSLPLAVFGFASADGVTHAPLGDMTRSIAEQTRVTGYGEHLLSAENWWGTGRFVTLVVLGLPYVVVDEIEVFGRERVETASTLPGVVMDVVAFARQRASSAGIARRLLIDVARARELVVAAPRTEFQVDLLRELVLLDDGLDASTVAACDQQAILPLDQRHARVFAIAAAALAAGPGPEIRMRVVSPWEPLEALPRSSPTANPGPLTIRAMRNERRAASLVIDSVADSEVEIALRPSGVPDGWLRFSRVPWTDTWDGKPVTAALLPLPADRDGEIRVRVLPGLALQLWIELMSPVSGSFRGDLEYRSALGKGSVPLAFEVADYDFPTRLSLSLGGFDYTDGGGLYDITATNRDSLIATLGDYFVDTPWASAATLPVGEFDEHDQLSRPPSTRRFEEWVRLWPEAREFAVFLAATASFAGVSADDPRYSRRIQSWVRFWADELTRLRIDPSRLLLLPVDEPGSTSQDRLARIWTDAIHAANAGPRTLINPAHAQGDEMDREGLARFDVVCGERGRLFDSWYRERLQDAGRGGARLAIYGAAGPVRNLDPYAYHRLQAWVAFDVGAKSSYVWSFADAGGASGFNEYELLRTPYSPLFMSAAQAVAGKHLAAFREGAQDYEYLALLARAVERASPAGDDSRSQARARAVLATAVRRVLAGVGRDLRWGRERHRDAADEVRAEVLESLLALEAEWPLK